MNHHFHTYRFKQILVIKKAEISRTCRKKHKKKMWISASQNESNQAMVR